MEKYCDNTSVGVIVQNPQQETLLLSRARFPFGWAAPAGHVDGHGSLEQTAVTELFEETGLLLPVTSLIKVIDARRVDNQCRRINGNHHIWTVYRTETADLKLNPSEDETLGARWFSPTELATMALQTMPLGHDTNQGDNVLEPIWLDFFRELEVIQS